MQKRLKCGTVSLFQLVPWLARQDFAKRKASPAKVATGGQVLLAAEALERSPSQKKVSCLAGQEIKNKMELLFKR